MIKIYFDDTLIDSLYYAGLTRSCTPYDENFKIGSSISETYTLTLDNRAYDEIPSIIKIYEDDDLQETLYVDDYTIDDFTTDFSLVDNMLKFNISYDASTLMSTDEDGNIIPTTLLEIFKDICLKAGVETDIEDFYQSDLSVSWYDNSYTARNYLEFVAEINGKNFIINNEGKLEFQDIKIEPDIIISFDQISDYKIGSKHQITRVLWDDSNNYWESGDDSGDTYYINTDNVYCLNQETVDYIYSKLKGLTFYDFSTSDCPTEAFVKGELIAFTDGDNIYNVFSKYDGVSYSGGQWFGGVDIELTTNEQEETEVIDNTSIIRSIKTTVDRDSNILTNVVTETQINSSKISDVDDDLQSYKDSVTSELSSTNLQIEVLQDKVTTDGVETVKNELVTIDIDGIKVSTNTSAIETMMTNDTFIIKSGDTYLAYFGYDNDDGITKAQMDNLTVTNFLVTGYHRIQQWETQDGEERTGVFWIGG